MNLTFIVDDYALIWNLLFRANFEEKIYKLKQKIWATYKNEYNSLLNDKKLFLNDYKNFIPNNDTIYNILLDNDDYHVLKKQADKYRIELMRIWDKNKKITNSFIKDVIRINLDNYNVFVVNKEFNIIEVSNNNIIIGRELNSQCNNHILADLNKSIIDSCMKKYDGENEIFKNTILELAFDNEYMTRLEEKSFYSKGMNTSLKKWLYPYWLMYLGVEKDDFLSYMMRDGLSFEVSKYAYEKELSRMNIEEFIDFCIRNKRYIVRVKNQIEVL